MFNRKLNVLVITNSHQVPPETYGGTNRIVHLLCDGLSKRGHHVNLIAGSGSKNYSGKTYTYQAQSRNYLDRAYRRLHFQWISWLASKDVDIVHSFKFWPEYHWLINRLQCPIIYHQQNTMLQPTVNNIMCKRQRKLKVVGISHKQIEKIEPKNIFKVVYNSVPTDKLTYYNQPKSPPYLAFLGRLNSDKAVDTAIEVSQKTGIPLKIAGTINQEEKGATEFFDKKVKPYLGNHCEWIGAINDEQKSEFLGGAVATLFPIRWQEPFGIVMPESLACGTPVIATRMGSVPEVIKDGKTGFICDSVAEMVQAVHNVEEIDRANCRAEAEKRFSADTFMNQVLELYEELLSSSSN